MKMNHIVKKTVSLFTLSVIFSAMVICHGFPVMAENGVNSRGNILLDNGDMSLYASDIDYLEIEKDRLLSELPVLPDDQNFDHTRYANIKSKGIIDYADGQVIIDANDFVYLANEIDALEAAYKMNTVAALNHMGTYYMEDGSITHDKSEESLTVEHAMNLSFEEIYEGVLRSQSVENLAITEEVVGASANNLTAGTASWVDGELIVGNGADNNASYQKGYSDGKASGYNEGYNAGRIQGQKDVVDNPDGYGVPTLKKFNFIAQNGTDSYTCPTDGTYNIQVRFSWNNNEGNNSCSNLIRLNVNGSIYTFLYYHFYDIRFIHDADENATNGQIISVNLPAGAEISIEVKTGDSSYSQTQAAWVVY